MRDNLHPTKIAILQVAIQELNECGQGGFRIANVLKKSNASFSSPSSPKALTACYPKSLSTPTDLRDNGLMTQGDLDLVTGTDQRLDIPWEVVLWNDPVSLISLVVRVLRKLFSYDLAKAERLTMQVHNEGKSVVWTGDKEQAAAYCVALHGYALSATIQQVS